MGYNSFSPNISTARRLNAFTIIELLVVIVIVSILTTITVLAYSGFSSKATVSSIQADLTNAKKALLSFQTTSPTNSFPTAINCTNPSSTEICLRPTGSNTYTYNVNNTSNPKTFNLTSTNGTTKYWINDYGSPVAKPGIVNDSISLHLDASDPSSYTGSGNIWYDISGNANNGTFYNGAAYSSFGSGSIAFNGINSYVLVLDSSSLSFASQQLTIDYWVYYNNISGYQGIIGKSSWEYAIWGNGSINFNTWPISGCCAVYGTPNISIVAGAWTNYVFTADGSNMNVYVNGSLVTTTSKSSYNLADGTANVTIGSGGAATGPRYLNGYIAIMRIYSRGFTTSEVLQNYNTTRTRFNV